MGRSRRMTGPRVPRSKKTINEPVQVLSERDMPDGYARLTSYKHRAYDGLTKEEVEPMYKKLVASARQDPGFVPYKLCPPGSNPSCGSPLYIQRDKAELFVAEEMRQIMARKEAEARAAQLPIVLDPPATEPVPAPVATPDPSARFRALMDGIEKIKSRMLDHQVAIDGMMSEVMAMREEVNQTRINTARIAYILSDENMVAAIELLKNPGKPQG